jgi:MFS transporter, AAHS family, 3-hydroxyphenylpropionic acid transporter
MNTPGSNQAARTTIVFCLLVAFCEGIDLQAAGITAAGIAAELKPNPDQFGNFFSASTFGLFFGALIGGRLADSVGRKSVLIISVGLFGLFSLLTSLAQDVQMLTWARLLTGLGLGGALPMVIALVSENTPFSRQSSSVAMVYAATPFGGAFASLVSSLTRSDHWRLIFVIGGVLPLLLTPLMVLKLPESLAFRQLGTTAIDPGQSAPAAMPDRGSLTAIFADGRALYTMLLWASFFLGLLLLYLLLNWLPTLLVTDGMTRVEATGAQIGFNVGGALAALFIGHLMRGRLRNVGIIITFIALPILLVTLAKAPAELAVVVATVFLLGGAVLAAQAFLYAMAPVTYPTSIRGIGVGAAVGAGRVGSIVGPKLGGILKAAGHGPSQLLIDLLPLVIVGSACGLALAWFTRPHKVGS